MITLLWTDGDLSIPVDWRVFDKEKDGKSKNDHLRQMLETARQRGFKPDCVLWDSWYSSLDNLKLLRQWGWSFFLGLKANRQVNPDGQGNSAIRDVGFPQTALPTHLKGFGWVISDRVEAGEEEVRFFISTTKSSILMKHKSSRSVKMPRRSRVTIGDSNRSATLSAVRPANSLTTSCWHYEPLYVWSGSATTAASAVGR